MSRSFRCFRLGATSVLIVLTMLVPGCNMPATGLTAADLQACNDLALNINNYYNANFVLDATLPTPEQPVLSSPLNNSVHSTGTVTINVQFDLDNPLYPNYTHHVRFVAINFETQEVDTNQEYYIPSVLYGESTTGVGLFMYNPGKYLLMVMDQYIISNGTYGKGGFAVIGDSPYTYEAVCVTVTLPGGEAGSAIPLSTQQACLDLLPIADTEIVNYDFYHAGKVANFPFPDQPSITSPANLSLLEAGPITVSVLLNPKNFDNYLHRARLLVMNAIYGNVEADESTFTTDPNVSFVWTPGPGIYVLLAFDQFVEMTFPALEVTAESEYIYSNLLCVAVRQMHYMATPGISDLHVNPGILPTLTQTQTLTLTPTIHRLPPTSVPTNTPAPACHDYGGPDLCGADPNHIGGCWWSADKNSCQP